MANLYSVAVRWTKAVPTQEKIDSIDKALVAHGDWLRFSGYFWLSSTDSPASALRQSLLPLIATEDSLLIIRSDPSDFEGWAEPWVWQWIVSKRPPPTRAINPLGLPTMSASESLGGLGGLANVLGGGIVPPKR